MRLLQQQAAVERVASASPPRPAPTGAPSSVPTHARWARIDAAEQRVGGCTSRSIAGDATGALGVALGDDEQRVQRRGLDRQPHVRVGLVGQLRVEDAAPGRSSPASTRFSAASRVSTSIRALAVVAPCARLGQPAPRVGQPASNATSAEA